MNRLMICALMALGFAAPARADRTPEECFPVCVEAMSVPTAAPSAASDAPAPEGKTGLPDANPTRCDAIAAKSLQTVEQVNADLKPVRELAGYIRSPQGLAFKLVNDHLFKIPPWVGFVLDPAGSLKRKALEEVRAQAKHAINAGACPAQSQQQPWSIDQT
ncbi:MAG TPA: hypothetical protein VFV17_10195 [Usitatibacteraceae bacterium]|nr:hypothetical protein [Usitatibacteraceae bacterium]